MERGKQTRGAKTKQWLQSQVCIELNCLQDNELFKNNDKWVLWCFKTAKVLNSKDRLTAFLLLYFQ